MRRKKRREGRVIIDKVKCCKRGHVYVEINQFLSTMSSVNLSKFADFVNLTVNFGLMLLLYSLSTFSEVIFWVLASPFLERIWDSLATREIHSPMPSIWTVPCFFMIILHKNNPWLSLVSRRTLKTSVLLVLGFYCLLISSFNRLSV